MNKPVYIGLPILVLSKIVMYEFWYDYVKPISLYTQKQMISTKTLQKMLKQDLILQIINQQGGQQKEKTKK